MLCAVQPAQAAARGASAGAHRRGPLRRRPRSQPLRRHRAVALRGRPGLPRRRQGRRSARSMSARFVHEGDVLAVLDDTDYRLAEEARGSNWSAADTQARQAESDRKRLDALKSDGSVSVPTTSTRKAARRPRSATAEADARKLELARNRLKYTTLRASRSGVVTAVQLRSRPGRRRRAAGRVDRRPRRAGDRRRRAGRPAGGLQGSALQGVAGERARRVLRRRAARAVAAGGRRRRAPIAPG